MNYNFKYYGQLDISNIGDLILNTELNWDEYTFRQTDRYGQADTKTIPLIWSEDFLENTTWKSYEIFKDSLIEIENNLIQLLGEGKIEVALLINLPKNKKILPHIDSGDEHFFKTKRIHIPITTNDKCNFIVGGETVQMKQGEIWEIDNAYKVHSVNNNGKTDRIHLLIDYQISHKKIKTLL
jgi:hypothetical protein